MKNEKKSYTYNRQNRTNRIELSKSNISSSPKIELKYSKNKSPKKEETYTKDLLENTRKYIEMSNGNNNYLISPISPKSDYSSKYISPSLNEEYDITKKYNDIYDYNDYSSNFVQDELDAQSGNEKLHRVKDEYIEYLQRQLDENNKNVIRLESKLNELQKKFKNLIDDNRLLNDALTEKGNKLNDFIIENESLRLQINNYIDNETKYKLQIQYYEKQIGLYETNIDDCNNIINDLKLANEKLSNNLTENLDVNNKSKETNNYTTTNSNNFNNYNYFNVRNINNNEGELNLLKNQNMIYENDIKSKDYTIEIITKKNNQLMSENKIYKNQIQQYAQQISNLYNILKQKNKAINIYRQKEGLQENPADLEYEKKLEELNMNFINNNELLLDISKDDIINTKYNYDNKNKDRLSQLMSHNENNKKKIDILHNKIKSLNPLDTKSITTNYTNVNIIDNGNNNISTNTNINSRIKNIKTNNKSPIKKENGEAHIQYGNSWRFLISPKKSHNKETDKIDKVDIIDFKNKTKQDKVIIPRNLLREENKIKEEKKDDIIENKYNKNINGTTNKNKEKHIKFAGILEEKEEIKEAVKENNRKKHNSHVPKVKKKFRISDFLDITEINTSSPVAPQNLSFSADDTEYISNLLKSSTSNSIYLFGIDREDYFNIFDIKDKKLTKKKILHIEDISDTFQKDYQYDGTILYNTLDGVFILTGKKSDILYHYNSKYDTINKICKFNNSHDNGSLLLDKEYNRLFVFGGKESKNCEYYSFNDKKIYSVPDLTIDRANASFILCNNKIYGFFGFSYRNNKYCGTIEYIDNRRLDRWSEIKNIKKLKENINFDVESVSTIIYKEDDNKILLYAGIQGDNEDYVVDSYYLFDTKDNSIDTIGKWNNKIMKYVGSRWRFSNLGKKDPAGYHFAKNTNFLKLPKSLNIEGYYNDIYLLMDYKNNVHFIDQDEKKIDIFRSDI